jgi:hypothetical protein
MSPPPEADGVTARLRRLVADEPPFAVPVSAALDSAVRAGRRRRLRTVLAQSAAAVCVVVALATAIGGFPPSPGPGPGPVPGAGGGVVSERVTVGLYSGRADPGWTLTADEREQLDLALATLAKATGVPPQGGLGYHGFRITRSDGVELVAYRGAVAPAGTARREYLADPHRRVERLLLRLAGDRLTPAERQIVTAELD